MEKKENQNVANTQPSALEVIQKELAYNFTSLAGLELALTHSSWANEHDCGPDHNQRLEFLGDAVLELCISQEIFHRFPEAREGAMTELRSSLVSGAVLAGLARKLGIDLGLRLGKGEERQEGRRKDTLLADAFEAVLAAVYEDGGFEAAVKVVGHVYRDMWPEDIGLQKEKDPKTRLQEECQKRYKATPLYVLLATSGPEHARIFDVGLKLPDGRTFTGRESSARKAEQAAASAALEAF